MARKIYITDAYYVDDLVLDIIFSDATRRRVDFGSFLRKHPYPQYSKYLKPDKFKKFHIEHGNLVWGKNWDLIFPLEQLYQGQVGNEYSPENFNLT